jgi:hypothetical protein
MGSFLRSHFESLNFFLQRAGGTIAELTHRDYLDCHGNSSSLQGPIGHLFVNKEAASLAGVTDHNCYLTCVISTTERENTPLVKSTGNTHQTTCTENNTQPHITSLGKRNRELREKTTLGQGDTYYE